MEVSPGHHDDFISLRPGQTWTRKNYLELPYGTQVGDVFKYEFNNRKIYWWGWGTKECHIPTTVKLPCVIKAGVVEPSDNEG
jgi:hypothetical protein